MSDMMSWFLIAGLLVILELFVGTFYLLMVAVGIVAGGIAAWAGAAVPGQALVAALVGVAATLLLHRRSRKAKSGSVRDPNISLDIGQSITVPEWHDGSARVMYRGALWDVDLAPGGHPTAGQYTIREIRGSRLIVS
jgi:membrane protein implicated in regulation of membrane protease activity